MTFAILEYARRHVVVFPLAVVVGKIFIRFLRIKSDGGGGESAGEESTGTAGGGSEGRSGGYGSKGKEGVHELHGDKYPYNNNTVPT